MNLFGRILGRGARSRAGDVAISVVVPLYNHAPYIAAALASVLAQSVAAHEIVVIDDGSTDDGAAIAERALRHTPGARVLRQDNRGAHAALNAAVEMTSGAWIAVLNSDDLFVAEKLSFCQEIIAADPALDLIAGGIGLIGGDGRRLREGPAVDWLRRAHAFAAAVRHPVLALLNENFVATTSNIVFTRALWQRLGGFVPLRYCHDLDFLMRAMAGGRVRLDTVREHVQYRVHETNTIAEERTGVDVELAAVMATALRMHGGAALPDDGNDGFAPFMDVARNKGLSDIVLYFMLLQDRLSDPHAFYRHTTAEAPLHRYVARLRAARA